MGYTKRDGKNGSGRLYGSVQYIGLLGVLGLMVEDWTGYGVSSAVYGLKSELLMDEVPYSTMSTETTVLF